MDQNEKKNQRIGLITSAVIHGVLLLIFIFAMAWRAPDPPLPEYGMIINVGFDDVGSGDVQTDQPVSDPEPEPVVEEKIEEQQSEPVVEDVPVDKVDKQEVVTSKIESPVVVKEETPKVKEQPKPKEPEKLKTEYKPENTSSNKTTENQGEKTPSQGNDTDKTGNKGQPDGKLNESTIYKGTPGGGAGGDGMSLAMAGWEWAEEPSIPDLPDNEDGQIVFEIECDENGDILRIETKERGLSARAEQLLRESIQRSSLQRNSAAKAPERSKGRVVFRLKTK